MTPDEDLMQQALEALVWEAGSEPALYAAQTYAAIAALRERLAQPKQEPMAWIGKDMTLRDYFAAKAVQGLLAQSMGTAFVSDTNLAAEYAYVVANAMLAVREEKK